jgi:hypothetical protein
MNGCSDPVLANWSAVSFPTISSCKFYFTATKY